MLIFAGWVPQGGVRRGRFGVSEVERHAAFLARGGGAVVAHSRIAGQAPRAARPSVPSGARSVVDRERPVCSRSVALGRRPKPGARLAVGPPQGVALTPGRAAPAGSGGGGGGALTRVRRAPAVSGGGARRARRVAQSSGRVASDQHQPASSRAMATQATVCFFLRVAS